MPPTSAPAAPRIAFDVSLLDGRAPVDPFRERAYRMVFVAAGVYNLAFGAWAGFWPGAFFRVFELPAPLYPSLWACLGMVVGVYGLLYLYAAARLERAWPIIAVGLLGKVLGPAGLLFTAATGGDLPLRMLSLLAFNDLVWWLPFGLFLLEGTRAGERVRAAASLACAAVHVLAIAAMALVLRGGTEAEPEVAARAAYILRHLGWWSAAWPVWMAAGMSVAGFYAWWGARIAGRRTALVVIALAGAGLLCDLLGESLYAAWLPWIAEGVASGAPGAAERFSGIQRAGTVLTGVFANGLYTLCLLALLLKTPALRGWARAAAWTAVAAGTALSACAAIGTAAGLVASSAVLFPAVVATCVGAWRQLRAGPISR